jgi:surfactin synthase thioesterase subunit
MLEGIATAEIDTVLTAFCGRQDIEIPGVEADDWMKVLSV